MNNDNASEVRQTTHAGLFAIQTPAFTTQGQTWFSVECIDSDGVSSFTQYFDVLVRDAVTPNYYPMANADLSAYNIKINDDSVNAALNNKSALSNLFAAAKQNGYNGIVML